MFFLIYNIVISCPPLLFLMEISSNCVSNASPNTSIKSRAWTKQMFYREVFARGSNTLVRSYNCHEICSPVSNGQWSRQRILEMSEVMRPIRRTRRPAAEPGKSTAGMMGKSKEDTSGKWKCIGDPGQSSFLGLRLWHLFILPTVLLIVTLTYWPTDCRPFDLVARDLAFEETMFGQTEALTNLSSALDDFQRDKQPSIVLLTGSEGVGKSLVVDILLQTVDIQVPRQVVYLDYMDKQEVVVPNSKCRVTLAVIEDIRVTNIEKAVELATSMLADMLQQNIAMLVVIVCRTDSVAEVHVAVQQVTKGTSSPLQVHHSHLATLHVSDVFRCLRREAVKLGMNLNEEQLQALAEEIGTETGCKLVTEVLLRSITGDRVEQSL